MHAFIREFKTQWFGGAVAMVPGVPLFFWLDLGGSRLWYSQVGALAVLGVAVGGLLITAAAAAWIARQILKKAAS